MKFSLVLLLIVFHFFTCLAQDFDSVNIQAHIPNASELLREKAFLEGKKIYFKPDWFNIITLKDDNTGDSLEMVLNKLLPPLDLKYVEFPPNHFVIVFDILHDNGGRQPVADKDENEGTYYAFDPTRKFTISGTITGNIDDEPVIGAAVFVNELKSGTVTNEFGFFSLTLPSALYNITVSAFTFNPDDIIIPLLSDTAFNIMLFNHVTQLQEIIISETAEDKNVSDISMGTTRLNIQTLRSIPPMIGEVDILRSILLLPGVTTVGEGATGFNVRGGSVDQNLILLDDAPIFNSSHLFGFFTAFSSQAIKDVTISKGGIPAQYGGRLSSILDVKIRQGNKNEIHGEGGIGAISANLLIDGPIQKDKTTFLVSGRASYSDWYLHALPDNYLKNSNAYFHDFIGKITHRVNSSNTLAITAYTSADKFKFPGDTVYGWSNNTATLKWVNTKNPKLNMMNSLVYSKYDYNVRGLENRNEFLWKAGIDYYGLKSEFNFNPDIKSRIDYGINLSYHIVQQGNLTSDAEGSNINPFIIDPENAIEMAVYYNHEYSFSPSITLMGGLRYSHFAGLGPGTRRIYAPGIPKGESTVVDEVEINKSEIMCDYGGFEPRVSFRYSLGRNTSIKASYNRMKQYIHLISNTSAVSPVDIWKLSDTHIKPQTGNQVSAGVFRNFKSNTYETSIELFFKYVNNSIDYKDGADIVLKRNLETEVLSGNSRSYGAELLIRKNKGRFNGWIAYTLSRSGNKVDGESGYEKINQGNFYLTPYDKLHDLAIVGNYDFTRRYSFGFNLVYNSGRPISYPSGSYGYLNFLIANFEYRNQERIPAYHRLDVALTLNGNHKKYNRWHGSWTFSIYNLYARKNPYSIFFKARGYLVPQAYKLSVIGAMIPSISYNFKF